MRSIILISTILSLAPITLSGTGTATAQARLTMHRGSRIGPTITANIILKNLCATTDALDARSAPNAPTTVFTGVRIVSAVNCTARIVSSGDTHRYHSIERWYVPAPLQHHRSPPIADDLPSSGLAHISRMFRSSPLAPEFILVTVVSIAVLQEFGSRTLPLSTRTAFTKSMCNFAGATAYPAARAAGLSLSGPDSSRQPILSRRPPAPSTSLTPSIF